MTVAAGPQASEIDAKTSWYFECNKCMRTNRVMGAQIAAAVKKHSDRAQEAKVTNGAAGDKRPAAAALKRRVLSFGRSRPRGTKPFELKVLCSHCMARHKLVIPTNASSAVAESCRTESCQTVAAPIACLDSSAASIGFEDDGREWWLAEESPRKMSRRDEPDSPRAADATDVSKQGNKKPLLATEMRTDEADTSRDVLEQLEEKGMRYHSATADVLEYAVYLGMTLPDDIGLLWIADQALQTDDPDGWKQYDSPNGDLYYVHEGTKQWSWQHPLEYLYQMMYVEYKKGYSREAVLISIEEQGGSAMAALYVLIAQQEDAAAKAATRGASTLTPEPLAPSRTGLSSSVDELELAASHSPALGNPPAAGTPPTSPAAEPNPFSAQQAWLCQAMELTGEDSTKETREPLSTTPNDSRDGQEKADGCQEKADGVVFVITCNGTKLTGTVGKNWLSKTIEKAILMPWLVAYNKMNRGQKLSVKDISNIEVEGVVYPRRAMAAPVSSLTLGTGTASMEMRIVTTGSAGSAGSEVERWVGPISR